jgi:GGDEF domain-containing protein
MRITISTSLRRVLGPDWSLKAEHAAAFDIAARLKADWAGTLVILLGLTLLSMWIVHPAISLVWCFLILQNEWVERRFAFHQRLDAPFGNRQLIRLVLQRTSGTLFWVVGALVLVAGEPSHRLLGLTLLIGIMVHVSLLYNTSRIQTLTTGLPCLAGFVAATIITLLDPQLTLDHKVITVFAIIAIFGYMMTATVQNLKIRDRLKNLVSEKTRLAAEDPLTGLQNRRSFVELVAAQKNTGRPLTLVFIDLDRFKPLNDQYGHAVGDQVLMEIGRRLNEQPDMLGAARLGGDEFAALFAAPEAPHLAELQVLALHSCLTAPIQCDS